MARKRNYRAEYRQRLALRGLRPASERPPDISARDLARDREKRGEARGHASRADLLADVQAGKVLSIQQIPAGSGARNFDGTYKQAELIVTYKNLKERKFVLRGRELQRDRFEPLRLAVAGAGVAVAATDSLSLFEEPADDIDYADYEDEAM